MPFRHKSSKKQEKDIFRAHRILFFVIKTIKNEIHINNSAEGTIIYVHLIFYVFESCTRTRAHP
mgnify:CR=1 FL=1